MSDETKRKILDVLRGPQLSTLATVTDKGEPWCRYVMATADESLKIWISTSALSRKVEQIDANPAVHLTCGVTSLESAQCYVQVQGKAALRTDAATRKANWNDNLKAYFTGPDDPSYVVIEVTPSRIEYCTMATREPEVWEG